MTRYHLQGDTDLVQVALTTNSRYPKRVRPHGVKVLKVRGLKVNGTNIIPNVKVVSLVRDSWGHGVKVRRWINLLSTEKVCLEEHTYQ